MDRQALEARAASLYREEARLYAERRPRSQAASRQDGPGMLDGVPLHWMLDWPTPFPMIVARAKGIRLTDIDGNRLLDFCLGDTGAMFGHAPAPILRALADRAEAGLTYMLPSSDAAVVGRLLAERFGLPHWQVSATASDANRFAIRFARAATGRRKILVFDGCYHGAVDETLVDLVAGQTVARRSLLGQAMDLSETTVSIPFNDPAALERALATGEIACVLAEPAMTNCSMILPQPGFHARLRDLTRAQGTLLLLDETHTVSTGQAGYAGAYGLEPDMLVMGKPIAGGVPASVWGFTEDVARRVRHARAPGETGHSGIGTTLSGSALQLACIRACLEELMTERSYARMEIAARRIETGLRAVITRRGLPWHVARVGARMEVVFRPEPLVDAGEARAAALPAVDRYIHLALLNRGVLRTPFHNMLLVGPDVSEEDADHCILAVDQALAALV